MKSVRRFAVNFMTSVAGLYLTEDSQMATPPETLIDVFTEWISDNPELCSAQQPPLALLPGAIPMALVPPIDGLIRWCVLAPLFLDKTDTTYSKLHLAILQSLSQVNFELATGIYKTTTIELHLILTDYIR